MPQKKPFTDEGLKQNNILLRAAYFWPFGSAPSLAVGTSPEIFRAQPNIILF